MEHSDRPAIRGAALHETHVSYVALIGDRAYKLKKPVCNGFLDWRSRESRRLACARELELNRRFAPDVYLDLADILGGDGAACDHLVVMRRMPEERRLSALLDAPRARTHVRAVARAVAAAHERAPHSDKVDAVATRDAVLGLWEANHEQMRRFAGSVLDAAEEDRLVQMARRFLAGRDTLFAERIRAGAAIDGHGDLLADDIYCLDDGPRILDCLEFDDTLRYGDVLADVAFLAMDIERLGHPELASALVADYSEFSGRAPQPALTDHYIAYRAQVRAKVACLRHEQGDGAAGEEAGRLVGLALQHAEAARVIIVLVGGGPGSGKTTLAAALGDLQGWAVISSDDVRKDLIGPGRGRAAPAPFGTGIYDATSTARTYHELVRRSVELTRRGRSVVLDATWLDPRCRALVEEAAEATWSDIVELRCEAPQAAIDRRLAARRRSDDMRSDATPAIARQLVSRCSPWPAAIVVDTSADLAGTVEAALGAIGRPRRATNARRPGSSSARRVPLVSGGGPARAPRAPRGGRV